MDSAHFSQIKAEVDQHVRNGHYEKAIDILERKLAEEPTNPFLCSLLGEITEKVNKQEAIRIYQQGLEHHPKNPYLNIGLGFLYFNMKDFRNAEHYLLNIWVEDPTNIHLLTALGKIYKQEKHFEKAIKYYRIGELLEPENTFVLYGMADTYRGLGDNETSLRYWFRFHELEPNNKVALTRIGDCYFKIGDPENALTYYLKALAIDYDFYANIGAARIYLQRHEFDKALEIYETIGIREQRNSRYYYEYINYWIQMQDRQKARELFECAAERFPGNTFISNLRQKIDSLPRS